MVRCLRGRVCPSHVDSTLRAQQRLRIPNLMQDTKAMRSDESGYNPYNSADTLGIDTVAWVSQNTYTGLTLTPVQIAQPSKLSDGPLDALLGTDTWELLPALRPIREPNR